jgi:putative tryptophan/tyrosine transport system permease protein
MLIVDSLQQTLLFLPLVFAIFLSYKVLQVIDLTVDGTFVLGAAVFARCITLGVSEGTSLIIALAAGFVSGLVVCCLQRFARITPLIASILAVFMLYSINFTAMGKPNISLLNQDQLLSRLQMNHPTMLVVYLILFMVMLTAVLAFMLHSRFGLKLRAFGVNKRLLKTIGNHPTIYLGVGLGLSNALAALSGVMTTEINGYADINMGIGMALTAIGSVVIGQKITESSLPKGLPFLAILPLISCFIGAYIYFIAMNVFLYLGVNPIYLKLCLGVILILFISMSSFKSGESYYDKSFD